MSFLYPRIKLVIAGDISTNQTWSIGLDFDPSATATNATLATWLGTIGPGSITTWWNATGGPKALNAADTRLTKLTAYFYDIGSDLADAMAIYNFGTPLVGTGTAYHPTQVCVCVTKVTDGVGRRYRGRCYVPATAQTLASNHQMSSGTATDIATAFAALVTDLNNDTVSGGSVTAIVVSQLLVGGSAITKIAVDSELDIQRRRADKLVGTSKATVNV